MVKKIIGRMRVLLLLVTVSTVLMGLINSQTFAAPAIKVACIGDSITEGVGTTNYGVYSYPAQLQKLLGPSYLVNNYGLGGRTLLKRGDIPYWNEAYYTSSRTWLPNIVVIQLGTNDTKSWNWVYKSEFVSNYVEFVNSYKSCGSNPQVYICYPPSCYSTSGDFVNTNTIIINEMKSMINNIASQTGVTIIDNHTATVNMSQNFPDGVHPNNTGAFALSANVYKALNSPGTKATFYQNADYIGLAVSLPAGDYNGGMMLAAGIPNDWMSSLKVPAGYIVEVYQNGDFMGTKWTFTADTSWVGSTCNDQMSAFKIIPPGPTFYQDLNFGGLAVRLARGSYSGSQMLAAGIPNDWMTSLKVPSGYTVEVYQNGDFTGTKWVFTTDNPWVGSACNDQMSAVNIY